MSIFRLFVINILIVWPTKKCVRQGFFDVRSSGYVGGGEWSWQGEGGLQGGLQPSKVCFRIRTCENDSGVQ